MLARHVDQPRDIVERGRRGRSAIRKDKRKHGPSARPLSTVKLAPKTTTLGSCDRCTKMVRPRHRASNSRVSPGAPNVVQWIAMTSERREVTAVSAARATPAMGLEVQEVGPIERQDMKTRFTCRRRRCLPPSSPFVLPRTSTPSHAMCIGTSTVATRTTPARRKRSLSMPMRWSASDVRRTTFTSAYVRGPSCTRSGTWGRL